VQIKCEKNLIASVLLVGVFAKTSSSSLSFFKINFKRDKQCFQKYSLLISSSDIFFEISPQNLATLFTAVKNRVTRLGEFSPIGQLFTLDTFKKILDVSQIFGLLFSII
jgi:hypothetical protein